MAEKEAAKTASEVGRWAVEMCDEEGISFVLKELSRMGEQKILHPINTSLVLIRCPFEIVCILYNMRNRFGFRVYALRNNGGAKLAPRKIWKGNEQITKEKAKSA